MGASAELLALVRASRDRIAAERARGRRRIRNTIAGLAAGLLLVSVLAILAVVLADNGRHGTHAFDAGRTQDAWMKGDVEDAVTLLELQRPRPGFFWNPDLRGFEWYHWWEMCHRDRYPAKKHDYEVWAVAFDEDQTLVSVTGEWKQPVQLGSWKADGGNMDAPHNRPGGPKGRQGGRQRIGTLPPRFGACRGYVHRAGPNGDL